MQEITVINDGVDAELFCRRETNLRKSLNLGKAVIITFVGRGQYENMYNWRVFASSLRGNDKHSFLFG